MAGITIPPMRSLCTLLVLAIHSTSAIEIDAVAFTKLESTEELASIESGDECYLIDFGRPPAYMFANAARKFGANKKVGIRFAMTLAAWNNSTLPEEDAFASLNRQGLWLYASKTNPAGTQVTEAPQMGRFRAMLQGLLGPPKPVAARMDTEQSLYSVMKLVSESLKSQGAVRVGQGSDAVWMKNGSSRAEEWKVSDEPQAAAWRAAQENSSKPPAVKDEA